MSGDLPRPVRMLSRCLPRADREWILGDLVESACHRGLTGARRAVWLAGWCGVIAAGLCATRLRGWLVLAPARELAVGAAMDGRWAVRGVRTTTTLLGGLAVGGSIALMTIGVAILVATLLSASGLERFVP